MAYGEPLHPGMGPELPEPVYEFLAQGAAELGGPIHAPAMPDGGLPSDRHRDWLLEHESFTVLATMDEAAPHPELAAPRHWAGLLDLEETGRLRALILTILTPVQESPGGPRILTPWPRVVIVDAWDDLPERLLTLATNARKSEPG